MRILPPLALLTLLSPAPLAAQTATPAPAPGAYREQAERRAQLMAAAGKDAVLVLLSARGGEPFKQDPDFFYLTGLEVSGAALMLRPGASEDTQTLYLEPRDRSEERWGGAALGPGDIDLATGKPDAERQAAIDRTGFGSVKQRRALAKDLLNEIKRGRTLWMAAEPVTVDQPLSEPLRLIADLRDRHPSLVVKDLDREIQRLRVKKSASELAAMERAVEITIEAQREVARSLSPGDHEYEVKAVLEFIMKGSGAAVAFPSIVAAGPNATVLHYREDRRLIEPQDLVVVDIGAAVDGYAADISRTFPASGKFSERARFVYDLVLAAQDAALAEVRPGKKLRSDVHRAAMAVIEKAGYKDFFPHSTSHYVGLEVHDVGERDGVLEEGMVITIEPGVYLPAERIGVRIEDMALVTRDGHRLLTATLPRTAAGVEAMMAARLQTAPAR